VAGFGIETRIAAVNALTQVTLELLTSQAPRQHSSSQQTAAEGAAGSGAAAAVRPCVSLSVLQQRVLPALLLALRDYSRDNRGDVGSWVREAAMNGTTQLLLLLSRMLSPQQQEQGGSAAHGADTVGSDWSHTGLLELHSSLAVQLVGSLLQQSLERIARLRETSLINLQLILQEPPAAAAVPGADVIAAALPKNAAELAGVASLACVSRMGALLQLLSYRAAILEGLVTSIGGVDAALAKEASAALLSQVGSGSSSSSCYGSGQAASQAGKVGAAGAGSHHQELHCGTAALFLHLWQQESG